uniref:U3 small nucleolar ribonucleoprotein protein IMP3 n=1 Tax=Strombidium rassoulzadegani TaxID=1082188 RepID=A0A7S3CPJ3_9SPIT|mmetsp:Transcript_2193/g.3821  ORF Transcript_2193/g.3821 Transcript_2193/m.3821 type:complete len:184 (+) Transcript_2193:38-589(+)
MAMRKLKYHEQKLLKHTDLLNWKKEQNVREMHVLRRYHIQNRDDYSKYNKVIGQIQKLIAKLVLLKPSDKYRIVKTNQLVDKLYEMGLINSRQGLEHCEKVNVAAMCRRRLPVVMQRLKMAETVKEAVMYIEQGHIKVGVETVTDPAFHVNRNMEDHVTWKKDSRIRQQIKDYAGERDDFDHN